MSNWREIAEQIRQKIESGVYAFGAKLPRETELADHYSVSRSTVHRALEELEQQGFVESRKRVGTFVRRAQRERKHMIALIFDRVARNFDFPSSEMIDGIRQTLGDHYGLVLCDSKDSLAREASFITRMSKETDGIICFPIADQRDGNLLQLTHNAGSPVVVIDRIPQGYIGSSIVSDDRDATKQALRMLKARGHERIGFLGFLKQTVTSAMARHAAFIEGFDECFGRDGEEFVRWIGREFETNGSLVEKAVFDSVFSLTQGEEKITALYCIQDDLALKAMYSAERLGIQVPNQLEIVTVNEWPPLELMEQIGRPDAPPQHLSIPAEFIPSSPDNLPMLHGVHAWLEDEKSTKRS
jgi:GntR family transcriptional regulator, arabinose operon transcriptional repressor